MEKPPLALVTGATKGIGLAVAKMFLKRGCRVIGNYGHDEGAAERARQELSHYCDKIVFIKSDLSSIDGIEPLAEAVKATSLPLSYLVSNVGVTDKTAFGRVMPEEWNRVVTTNLTVPFFLVQRLTEVMPSDTGRVVFIGAVMGIRPHPMSFSYGASKAGLHFLAQCLVKVLSPKGITVNVVAPGFVETMMQADKTSDHRARVEGKISLNRFATADEIATAVESFLEQGYITGQVLCVDGGYDFK